MDNEIIEIVKSEINANKNALINITPKIQIQMRDAIEQFRKNYYGVFDNPIDPVTGRDLIFIPLTEYIVESVVSKIDLDTKDAQFRAKNPNGRAFTELVKSIVYDYFDEIYLGEHLDVMERGLAIDGTQVWKTYEHNGKLIKEDVDILNCYINPLAKSIQDAERFTERSIYTLDDFRNTGWENIEDLQGDPDLNPLDTDNKINNGAGKDGVPLRDVYEMWGLIPKRVIPNHLVSGGDDETLVEARVVVSGIDINDPVVHLVELNKKKDKKTGKYLKPYEEAWYQRMPNRWYGRGVAEKIIMLQFYVNTVVNIRINRAFITQLGLIKVRKGSGLRANDLQNLMVNGVVEVQNMADVEQLVLQEASQASYQDETNATDWAQRVTAAFDVVTGENSYASMPATNAAITDRNSRGQFKMVQDGIGIFLRRWVDRHVIPAKVSKIKPKDIVRLTGDRKVLQELVDRVVGYMAEENMPDVVSFLANREFKSVEEIDNTISELNQLNSDIEQARRKLLRNPELFVEILEDIAYEDVDTQFFVTNEEIDIGVSVQNAINLAQIAPEYKTELVGEIADKLGITLSEPEQTQPDQSQQTITQGAAQDFEQTIQANTL